MAQAWKYIKRVIVEDDRVTEYSISFFRQGAGDWHDELRYDSHDRRRGHKSLSPHFHMKMGSAFKSDSDSAVEEIKGIIDNYVEQIKGVLDK
jgi:hypothetical protein